MVPPCVSRAGPTFSSWARYAARRVLMKRWPLLARHAQLEPGDLPAADVKQNLHSLESDGRIFSAYTVNGTRFWVITEWDRSCTTVLLPSEY